VGTTTNTNKVQDEIRGINSENAVILFASQNIKDQDT
jgi:hypothetical protein